MPKFLGNLVHWRNSIQSQHLTTDNTTCHMYSHIVNFTSHTKYQTSQIQVNKKHNNMQSLLEKCVCKQISSEVLLYEGHRICYVPKWMNIHRQISLICHRCCTDCKTFFWLINYWTKHAQHPVNLQYSVCHFVGFKVLMTHDATYVTSAHTYKSFFWCTFSHWNLGSKRWSNIYSHPLYMAPSDLNFQR
jgi:hypothetical protein